MPARSAEINRGSLVKNLFLIPHEIFDDRFLLYLVELERVLSFPAVKWDETVVPVIVLVSFQDDHTRETTITGCCEEFLQTYWNCRRSILIF